MNIQAWAERTLKVVEENGHAIRCVRLISVEGTPWERWEAPFPTPEEFQRQVTTVTEALAEEWPAKKVQLMLVAEDTQGTAHSQCPFTVWGKNKQASTSLFQNDGSRAMAEGMDQIVRTVERVLSVSNTQMRQVSEFNEKLLASHHDLLDLIKQKEEHAALTAAQSAEVTNALGNALKDNLPMLIQIGERLLSGSSSGMGRGAAKVLNGVKKAADVAAVINGTPPTPTPGE